MNALEQLNHRPHALPASPFGQPKAFDVLHAQEQHARLKAEWFLGERAIDQEPAAACQASCHRRPGCATYCVESKVHSLATGECLHTVLDGLALCANRRVAPCLQ